MKNPVTSVEEAKHIVLDGLQGAVRRQMMSERPLGVFLSGGVDSSALVALAAQHVSHTKRLLGEAGIPCPIVTGAGSGTLMFEVEAGVWDEIQCGSYAFMDVDYAKNEWAAPLPRFEHSLFVLSTVMSRPSPKLAILDAGLKASSVDSGMPTVWQRAGLHYAKASDEHGVVASLDQIGGATRIFTRTVANRAALTVDEVRPERLDVVTERRHRAHAR